MCVVCDVRERVCFGERERRESASESVVCVGGVCVWGGVCVRESVCVWSSWCVCVCWRSLAMCVWGACVCVSDSLCVCVCSACV